MSKSTKWFLGILAVLVIIGAGFTLISLSVTSLGTRATETYVSGSGDKIAVVELTELSPRRKISSAR